MLLFRIEIPFKINNFEGNLHFLSKIEIHSIIHKLINSKETHYLKILNLYKILVSAISNYKFI